MQKNDFNLQNDLSFWVQSIFFDENNNLYVGFRNGSYGVI